MVSANKDYPRPSYSLLSIGHSGKLLLGFALMGQPVLKVQNLSIRRGGTPILERLDWSVDKGQHWVILGANGSGKTSLFSALTGYLTPSQGEIIVLGERYGRSNWPELRRRIGLVSSAVRQMMADSEPGLSTVVSGKTAVIDYWEKPSRSDLRRGRSILEQLSISHLEERPWAFLSQGERQRILIGRALMADPDLLILDEPCAGLDPVAREHFLQFIERTAQKPGCPTLLLVTHHVEEITPAFTHVLLLKQGKLLASGPRKSILNSGLLSRAFDFPVRLRRQGKRMKLMVDGFSKIT